MDKTVGIIGNGFVFPKCDRYFKENINSLKYKFKNVEKIENNYSQALQDMFVLTMLDGKMNGTYVEIGGDHGVIINNTYLLESIFGWDGVAFEIDSERASGYNNLRENKCQCVDALIVDYSKVFSEKGFGKQIDYLQLDIDPAQQTLNCLKRIPLNQYRFSVITYETDIYQDGPDAAEESREILRNHGYELVVKNVSNCGNAFEDWYVDPTVVSKDIIKKIKVKSSLSTEAKYILIGEK
jgi:hypothetical protein